MNENTKTGLFAAAMAVIGLLSWLTLPKSSSNLDNLDSMIGKSLYEYDPDSASSLKIVRFNTSTAKREDFEVAKEKASNTWTIPSRAGYPADATKQMSEAANAFLSVKVLGVATDSRDEHKMFQVLEPDEEKVGLGDEGVGTLVQLKDDSNNSIVNLIIGATEKNQPTHRFVRFPTQDRVYVVELDTNALSTDFTRWIESDLLKLSSNDIQTLGIRDYSISQTAEGGQLNPVFDADVSFSATDGKWSPDSITVHQGADSKPRVLAANEQLNSTKLNEIKNALDSLRIVDVFRKPKGLASDFKVEKALLDDRESIISLFRRGFIPQKGADGGSEIYATSGELLATLKDGVQYLIRFGNTTGESSDEKSGEKKELGDGLQMDRYMLVSAKLDESKYPAPDLKPLPETYEDLMRMEGNLPEATPTIPGAAVEPAAPVATPAGEEAPPSATVEPTVEPTATEPKGEGEPEKGGDGTQANLSHRAGKLVGYQDGVQPPEEGEAPKPATAGDSQPPEATAPTAEAVPTAVQDPSKSQPPTELTEEEKKEKLEAARERITKENQRKVDERNEKLSAARKKVGELNARFADWFYVISESEYKKMRIKLEELIQAKGAAPNPGAALPNFGQ